MSVLFWAKGRDILAKSRTVSTDAIYLRRKTADRPVWRTLKLVLVFFKNRDRLNSILVSTRESQEGVIFTIWLSCFSGQKLNSIKRKDIWLVITFLLKRTSMLPWQTFHNKFFVRDRITFCSYAINFDMKHQFWGDERDHRTIKYRFVGYRGISIKQGKNVEVSSIGISNIG